MLAKSKGYFLIDLLLALNIIFLIGLTFVPLYVQLDRQFNNLYYERDAKKLLYDKVQQYVLMGTYTIEETIYKQSLTYTITMDQTRKEGCVRYIDANKTKKQYCLSFE